MDAICWIATIIVGVFTGFFIMGQIVLTNHVTFKYLKAFKQVPSSKYPQFDVIYQKGVRTKIINCFICYGIDSVLFAIMKKVGHSEQLIVLAVTTVLACLILIANKNDNDCMEDLSRAYGKEFSALETPEEAFYRNSNAKFTKNRYVVAVVLFLILPIVEALVLSQGYTIGPADAVFLFYPFCTFVHHWKDMFLKAGEAPTGYDANQPSASDELNVETFDYSVSQGEIEPTVIYSERDEVPQTQEAVEKKDYYNEKNVINAMWNTEGAFRNTSESIAEKIKDDKRIDISYAEVTRVLIDLQTVMERVPFEKYQQIYKLYEDLQRCDSPINVDIAGYSKMCQDVMQSFDSIEPFEIYGRGGDIEMSALESYLQKKRQENPKPETVKAVDIKESKELAEDAADEAVPIRNKADDDLGLIEKLSELHKKGILTDEEFSKKKADILGRL